jgi:hypothetical protein
VASRDSAALTLVLGNGDGTFRPATVYQGCNGAGVIVIADLNGDGTADILTGNYGSGRSGVCVWIGAGDGTVGSPRDLSIDEQNAEAIGVSVGDLNGDGVPDLVVAGEASPAVKVLLGIGDGTFQAPVDVGGTPRPGGVVMSDLNGDGRLDLAVDNAQGVTVLLGNGDGTFQTKPRIDVVAYRYRIRARDVNGDGKQDLLVALAGSVGVLLGNGDGTFMAKVEYAAGNGPSNVDVSDLNGDGAPDLAVTNEDGGSVTVLLRTACY